MAAQAVADFDENGDEQLSTEELAAAPGLKYCARQLDAEGNRDGRLNQAEIRAWLDKYRTMRTGLVAFQCTVLLDQQPLDGATVRLVPEPFLREAIAPVEATSGPDGTVRFAAAGSHLSVVPPGIYRVEITSQTVRVPDRYNTQTTLGVEVSGATDAFHFGNPIFAITAEE